MSVCVEEKVGEVAIDLARELGAVLHQKLHIVIEDSSYSGDLAGSAAGGVAAGDWALESVSYSPIFGQISGVFKLLPAPADRFQCC